ncbi:MAG: antA/AntB antirepressor family protein [Clostridium sp.]|uniref:antA/AntB antirepressor family protein n=1 Tax=Clostridium sp. TaxID=1506 RepID=UPI003EE70A6E
MELIKVEIKNGVQVVSAEDLRVGLEIKTKLSVWFPRMVEYGFEENIDYTRVFQKCSTLGGEQTKTDYAITLDMAKEISMIQRNAIGKKFRQYFIDCEKKLQQQTPMLSDFDMAVLNVMKSTTQTEKVIALKEFQNVIEKPLLETIEVQKPKADRYEAFLNNEGTFNATEVATFLGLKSAQTLNKKLHEEKVIKKSKSKWLPTSESISKHDDWFRITPQVVGFGSGEKEVTTMTFTPIGIIGISELLGLKIDDELIK